MNAQCAQRVKIMGFTRSDPKMRRMAACAASLAVIGFVGGALIEHPRRAQDNSRGNAISVVPSSVVPSQQAREDGLPQEPAVRPEPVEAPAAEPSRPDALGVDVLPDASYDALRRAIELFRKGGMTG